MTTIRDAFDQFLNDVIEPLRPAMEHFDKWSAINDIAALPAIPCGTEGS